MSRPRLSLKILEKYCTTVQGLGSYLQTILPATPHHPIAAGPGDSLAYATLLQTSLVGLKTSPDAAPRLQYAPPSEDMLATVQQAQKTILKRKKYAVNVITAGYQIKDRSLASSHVNTNITALTAPEWDTLLTRIGTNAMMHLLLDTNIFVALPNDCFCQLVGVPITIMYLENLQLSLNGPPPPPKRPREENVMSTSPNKRRKLDNGSFAVGGSKSNLKTIRLSPARVVLVRRRLFYGRPIRHSHHLAIGLPPQHILNQLNPNGPGLTTDTANEPYVDPDPREQMDNARRFSKYVFPRQYGLSNPFNFKNSSVQLPDFSKRIDIPNRENLAENNPNNIKTHGSYKTPKRLKDVISMLEKLIWRHGKCKYKLLRDSACPSKVKALRKDEIDSSSILEVVARTPSAPRAQNYTETHTQPRTQQQCPDTSLDSEGNTIIASGNSQAAAHARMKPRCVEYACSHFEVYRFVVLVSKAVIPPAFWGSEANFKHVLRHAKDFIACRRFESLSLHHIVQGFSTSACEWLMPPGDGARQTRVPVSDAKKRRELLEDFLFWYFDGFLLPLLKTTFYVTESSALRNHVLYFRQDDWAFLCAPLVESLTAATYQKITETEYSTMLEQRKLGYSFIRLLPKEMGVRPIANLKSTASGKEEKDGRHKKSINDILQAAFKILTYERDNRPGLVGASVFSTSDTYDRLKQYKARLPRNHAGKLPKLYFVKLDVQACFDTITQSKLLEVLRGLITEDAYTIQRYGKVTSSTGKVKKTWVKRAVPEGDYPHFLKVAGDLANVLHSTIFVDQVRYDREEKEDILRLLEEHITDNIVKLDGQYYRQVVGISQGSVMSSLLCAFFYGDLEKRFGRYSEDPQSMLLRQTDDYLFVTTDPSRAKGFLDMMEQGHPEYGCFISKDKTLKNFDHGPQLNTISPGEAFPWCGYMINTRDLSVSVEYSRYHGSDLRTALTVARGRNPGGTFRHKMLQLAKARSHIIYNDTDLNAPEVVYLNIYQNFLLCALKMDLYIRERGLDTKKYAKFLAETVQQMIRYSFTSIKNNSSTRLARSRGGKSEIQKAAVTWLGMHAFDTILSRKPTRYSSLMKMLRVFLTNPLQKRYSRRFKGVTGKGFEDFVPMLV